ncbi:MAG: DUF3054 domain-containing protein, partial [Anaerolineales bacterium]
FFVLLAYVFIFQAMEGKDSIRISILLLSAITSAVYWSARPHIITLALSAYFLWILEAYRIGKNNWLWTLPIGMALWANIHGGFAVGFILIACYLMGELIDTSLPVAVGQMRLSRALEQHKKSILSYVLVGLLCAITVSINPQGPRMLLYPFMTVGIESLRAYIQEWQSPDFHSLQVLPFVVSILLLLLSFGISKIRRTAHEFVLSSVFLFLALTAARNIALFALVSAPILSRHLSSGSEPLLNRIKSKDQFRPELVRALNLVLLCLCIVAATLKISIPLRPSVNLSALEDMFPYGAVKFLTKNEIPGPMFNSYNWGAFILWELYPHYRTFVDGRTDLFNDEILEDYLAAWRGEPEWREILQRWDIQLVFIEPEAPVRYQLDLDGWETIYQDDESIIMVP